MSAVRKLLWPGLATLIALATLLSLGSWQLSRKAEKEAQLRGLAMAMTSSPLDLNARNLNDVGVHGPGVSNEARSSIAELTRVTISGVFMQARNVPVRATLPATSGGLTSGIGFFWMTPLETQSGDVVFINRGFVNSGSGWKAPAVRTPEGPQVISGLMRKPERKQMFTPTDIPAQGEYFTRDPITMAQAAGLSPDKVAFFFIDAERQPGNLVPPIGADPREMIARIPNNHLQYAVTWFGFALTLIGVFGFFARARLRETA
jgi:surfeit locus 1 family protein